MTIRNWEYAEKGDYHRNLDKNWRYYPVYVAKMQFINTFLSSFPKDKEILDVGCGEGVIVEELRKQGYSITGMDANYESECVSRGDITNTKLPEQSFDLVLCLDVLEHLDFSMHEEAIKEMHRILKPDGILLITLPNLAHLLSRLSLLLTGNLIRTSEIERHPGDRPINEFIQIIKTYFVITKRKGFFPTFPLISLLTHYIPRKSIFLHKIENMLLAVPGWCFLNCFICRKK